MKYIAIPMILHVPDNVDVESVILMVKDYTESQNSKIMVCEESKWKDSDDFIYYLSELSSLQNSETQF